MESLMNSLLVAPRRMRFASVSRCFGRPLAFLVCVWLRSCAQVSGLTCIVEGSPGCWVLESGVSDERCGERC
jgi:hypothetical protein